MDMYQEVRLKGQKLNMSSLIAQPEFKQQYLAPLRTLNPVEQVALLKKLAISLSELKAEAQRIKAMQRLKNTFVRLTEEQLGRFVQCDLRKNVPQVFLDFCLK